MMIRAVLLLMSISLSCMAAEDAPPWLRTAASANLPKYDTKVPAVILLKEERVSVDDSGRVTTTSRAAVRILTREGRSEAIAAESYMPGSSKVRDLKAWVIRAGGEAHRMDKDRLVDVAAGGQNDLYADVRVKAISAEGDVEDGAVFGYESVVDDRSVFTQHDWRFQDRNPALVSRFQIALPAGWRAEGVMFNHEKVAPVIEGSTYTWELRDLPFIEREPESPHIAAIAPRLAVSYFPPSGNRSNLGRSMSSWTDVSQWLSELEETQAGSDDRMTAHVKSLVDGAGTELEKIRAISKTVQAVKYVSVQTGIGRGGGYKPHAATEVFQRQYGDCKDKANLMRAMLRVAGINSYMVSIWSGDPTYVRAEWPSPQQFNHAIIAVSVSAATVSPAVLVDAKLGRLLFFDPTDSYTPLGDLPWHEQGSLALVDAGADGALVRVPVLPAAANRVERASTLTLAPDGGLEAKVHEEAFGQEAVNWRHLSQGQAKEKFTKSVERWVMSGAPGATIASVEPNSAAGDGKFSVDLGFASKHYAQLTQGRLLLFRPAVLPRHDYVWLTPTRRTQPVVLEAQMFEETAKVNLPAGFTVDELPDAATIKTSYGSFAATWKVTGTELVFTRRLEVPAAIVAPDHYDEVRSFFDHVSAAEQSAVVLLRR